MRPRGTHGEIARALLEAAQDAPGTVIDLAHRAQVSVPVARYTASRLLDRDALRVVQPGRPAVLGAAAEAEGEQPDDACAHLMVMHSLWWGRPAA